MKKPFIEINTNDFRIEAYDIKPIDGYQAPKDFSNHSTFYKTIVEDANKWFKKFPNCCDPHKVLKTKSWFKKDNYKGIPQKIVQQFSFTEYHIIQRINSPDWYKDIIDYIDYNVLSFGAPAIGLHLYFIAIIDYIRSKDTKIDKEKKQKLYAYIGTYYDTSEQTPDRDLNILYATYQKWLKTFPFEVSYFNDVKQQFAKQFPIIKGEIEHNPYSGLAKAKLYTQSELIEVLENQTKQLLDSINVIELVEKGIIADLNKEQIQLENESLKIDIAEITKDYAEGELKYVKVLKKWLNRHSEYFDKIGRLIKDKPISIVEPLSKEKETILQVVNNFDHVKIEEVYHHFHKGLVEKKYLTEDELLDYLKAAFEQMVVPPTRFRLRNTPTRFKAIKVFNEYYKFLVGKPYGKQKKYAALLGDYFEGYTTENVSTNFSR